MHCLAFKTPHVCLNRAWSCTQSVADVGLVGRIQSHKERMVSRYRPGTFVRSAERRESTRPPVCLSGMPRESCLFCEAREPEPDPE